MENNQGGFSGLSAWSFESKTELHSGNSTSSFSGLSAWSFESKTELHSGNSTSTIREISTSMSEDIHDFYTESTSSSEDIHDSMEYSVSSGYTILTLNRAREKTDARCAALKEAQKHGKKLNNRISVFFIGQDGVGKTSLKKNLLGEDFNPQQPSTVGVDVDVVEVKQDNMASPWQCAQDKNPFATQEDIDSAVVEIAASRVTSSTITVRDVERSDRGVNDEIDSESSGEEQDEPWLTNRMQSLVEEQEKVYRYTDELEWIRFLTYDVAGQSIFYDVHSVLLRLQALFVLVVSLDKDLNAKAESLFVGEDSLQIKIENYLVETNLDYVMKWMATLHNLSKCDPKTVEICGKRVTLPATFLVFSKPNEDEMNMQIQAVKDRLMKTFADYHYAEHIVKTFVIDNKSPDKGVLENLRSELFLTAQCILRSQYRIPITWLKLERGFSVCAKSDPYITWEVAQRVGAESKVNDDFVKAVECLHQQNVIVHFNEDEQASDLVVLDPNWLVQCLSKVITVPQPGNWTGHQAEVWNNLTNKGVLTLRHLLTEVLPDHEKQSQKLIRIMQLASLICRWDEETFLVPSMVQSKMEKEDIESSIEKLLLPSLYVNFTAGNVPIGLFTRFQVEFIEWCIKDEMSSLFCNFSCFPQKMDGVKFSVSVIQHVSRIQIGVGSSDAAVSEDQITAIAIEVKSKVNSAMKKIQEENYPLRHAEYSLAVKCNLCSGLAKECDRHQKKGCLDEDCAHLLELGYLEDESKHHVCDRKGCWFDTSNVRQWLEKQDGKSPADESSNSTRTSEDMDLEETATDGNYAADIANINAFEKKLVEYSKQKLEKYERMVDNPTVGKKAEQVGNLATGFSCVAAIAAAVATGVVGVLPVAAAVPLGVAGPVAVLGINVVGKYVIKRIRKTKCKITIDVAKKAKSDPEVIVKQAGKELSRIYEYQLSMLKDAEAAEIMARSAVDLMLNLKDGDSFDRNTLLRKVLDQEGSKGVVKKQELKTKPGVTSNRKKWHTPGVFWKSGYDDQRDLKINKKYGFLAKFLLQDDGGDGNTENAANTENGENLKLVTVDT